MKKFFLFAALTILFSSCGEGTSRQTAEPVSAQQERFVGADGVFSIEALQPYTVEFKDLGDVLMIRYRFSGEELRKLHVKVDSKVYIENSIGAEGQFADGSYFAASFTDSFITLKHLSDNEKLLVFRETLQELVIAVGLSEQSRHSADSCRLAKKPILIF